MHRSATYISTSSLKFWYIRGVRCVLEAKSVLGVYQQERERGTEQGRRKTTGGNETEKQGAMRYKKTSKCEKRIRSPAYW